MSRSLPTAVLCGLGLLPVIALWSIGRIAVLAQRPMLLLWTTALVAALGLVAWGISCSGLAPAKQRLVTLAGCAALAGALVFPASVLWIAEGPVPIDRRVGRPRQPPATLSVVSFNVLHGYPEFHDQEARFRRQARALRALEPDVVVLQEAWRVLRYGSLPHRLGRELEMDVAYARANGSLGLLGFEEGSAVLSRWPILEARRLVLSPRGRPWRARIALLTTVDLGGGEHLTVVGTHLTNLDPQAADAQAFDLAGRLPASGSLIVGSDLNRPSDSAAVRVLTAHGLIDAIPGEPDHLLVRGADRWQIAGARRALTPADLVGLFGDSVAISDHLALAVDLAAAYGRRSWLQHSQGQ